LHVARGQLIGGRYELARPIGKGSMGEVWLARHATTEAAYAVKLIDTDRMPDAAGRFQMEALIAAKLSKKTRHVVSVTDHGEEGTLAYLVMELLEGESLEALIERAAPLPIDEVSAIVTQVSRALTCAHSEGFVHRDLKPGNVFLTRDEEGRIVVKLLDFGIARTIKPVRTRTPFATAKDTIIGSPSYMSPEQARGADNVDHRCDLWALAVVAYEALTGALPFEGETLQDTLISIGIGRETPIRDRRPDLPEAIAAFYAEAFAFEIEERFTSAHDLSRAFTRAAGLGDGSRPSTMPPTMLPSRPPAVTLGDPTVSAPSASRGRWTIFAVAVLLPLIGAGVFVLSMRSRPPADVPASPPPTDVPSTPLPPPVARPVEPLAPPTLPAARPLEPPRNVASAAPLVAPAIPTAVAAPSATPPPSATTPAPARSIDRSEVF
jgi:eukaryotic-like serine/threonine-protein kinase